MNTTPCEIPVTDSDTSYQISRGSDLPEKITFKRIGIIPYFLEESIPYFLLMIDAKFNEITDAGGISRRREKWSRAASRETREETRGIFNYSMEDVESRGIVIYRNDLSIAIVFMYEGNMTREKAYTLCCSYQTSYNEGIIRSDKKETLENSEMVILSIKELSSLMKVKKKLLSIDQNKCHKVYRPVRFMLRYAFKNFLNDSVVESNKMPIAA